MLQHMYGYRRGCITVVYPGHAGGPADVLGDVLADVLGDVLADVRDDIFRDVLELGIARSLTALMAPPRARSQRRTSSWSWKSLNKLGKFRHMKENV